MIDIHVDVRVKELLPGEFSDTERVWLESVYIELGTSQRVQKDHAAWIDGDHVRIKHKNSTVEALREDESYFLRLANWHDQLRRREQATLFLSCACVIGEVIRERSD